MKRRQFKIIGDVSVIDMEDLSDEKWEAEKAIITLAVEEEINSAHPKIRLHLSFPESEEG